jgi:hypothetical protein
MTFWNFFLLLLIYVPLLLLWGTALVDIFQRDDLSGGRKALWVVVVLVLPLFGTLIYLVSRPAFATSGEQALREELNREFVARYAPSDHAQQLQILASLHDRGKLTDDEYAAEKARLSSTQVPSQPSAEAVRTR